MTQIEQKSPSNNRLQESLIEFIGSVIEPLGFEVVHLEIVTQRTKTLRLYIDRQGGVGIEDCATVSRTLGEEGGPLDKFAEIAGSGLLTGAYELEVSSPGLDRPLRQEKDYSRFAGREARIHVYRPLSAEEIANGEYQQKNPKQKNFVGTLQGVENGKVILAVSPNKPGHNKKKNLDALKNSENSNKPGLTVRIPISLISKANLEPQFEI